MQDKVAYIMSSYRISDLFQEVGPVNRFLFPPDQYPADAPVGEAASLRIAHGDYYTEGVFAG